MHAVRNLIAFFACLAALPAGGAAYAKYVLPDLEEVPVAKLVENLEKAIQAQPNNATLRFNLARVHGMAYALKTEKEVINKEGFGDGYLFGYNHKFVPFTLIATEDEAMRKAAKEHLAKAIKRYQETVVLAPDNLAARLGLGWTTEQSGDKVKAIMQYRDVIARGWNKEKDLKRGVLGGHYITAEGASYLIPLLDPQKDRAEIVTLKERTAALQRLRRPVTPIATPLREGLAASDLVDPKARVAFDADGTGLAQQWTWLSKDAGWLVYDRRGQGKITSGLQMFGNVTFWLFWDNGYQALAALDNNGDGVLTGEELNHLAVWVDRNGDGVAQPGELKTLAELDIVALSCRHEYDSSRADHIAWSRAGVVFRNGTTRPTYDVILHRR